MNLIPVSRFLRLAMACLATSAIASILGVDTNNSLALEAAEVVARFSAVFDCAATRTAEVEGWRVSTFCVVGHAAEIDLVSFLVVAVCRVDFAAGSFSDSFLDAALVSSSVVFVPRSKRTLRTCLHLGGVARGGVAARDVTGDNGLDGRGTTRRVSRCGDDDAEDSLRALFWRRPVGGDGDLLSDGVDAPDPAGVVSLLKSVSTNSRDLYLESRLGSCTGSSLRASSMSAGVAGVPSGRHLCRVIR